MCVKHERQLQSLLKRDRNLFQDYDYPKLFEIKRKLGL